MTTPINPLDPSSLKTSQKTESKEPKRTVYMLTTLPIGIAPETPRFYEEIINMANKINQQCRIEGGHHSSVFFVDRKKIPAKLNIAGYNSKDHVVLALVIPNNKLVHEINRRLAHVDMIIKPNQLKAYYHTHNVKNLNQTLNQNYKTFNDKGNIFYRVSHPYFEE
ncbi:MAG: hypothetical protein ACX932_01745 [Gammaproteobacteria bacterium]